MSFCDETTPTAKRAHRCLLCDHVIPAGEKHVKRVGVWDGDFSSFRMHSFCCEVANIEYDHDAWELHDPFDFRDTLAAHEAARSASL